MSIRRHIRQQITGDSLPLPAKPLPEGNADADDRVTLLPLLFRMTQWSFAASVRGSSGPSNVAARDRCMSRTLIQLARMPDAAPSLMGEPERANAR